MNIGEYTKTQNNLGNTETELIVSQQDEHADTLAITEERVTVETNNPWRPQDADREYIKQNIRRRVRNASVTGSAVFIRAKPKPTIQDGRPAVFRRFGVQGGCQRVHNTDGVFSSIRNDIDHRRGGDAAFLLIFRTGPFVAVALDKNAQIVAGDSPTFSDLCRAQLAFPNIPLDGLWMDVQHIRNLLYGVVVFGHMNSPLNCL